VDSDVVLDETHATSYDLLVKERRLSFTPAHRISLPNWRCQP
jgi:hypothetical protein